MTKNLNSKSVSASAVPVEEHVGPGLRRFVRDIRARLGNQTEADRFSPATVQSAEILQKKFTEWGSQGPDPGCGNERGSHLFMDYILHHRIGLVTEIVKSMGEGRRLSQNREKVLKNSIDYIEQNL